MNCFPEVQMETKPLRVLIPNIECDEYVICQYFSSNLRGDFRLGHFRGWDIFPQLCDQRKFQELVQGRDWTGGRRPSGAQEEGESSAVEKGSKEQSKSQRRSLGEVVSRPGTGVEEKEQKGEGKQEGVRPTGANTKTLN